MGARFAEGMEKVHGGDAQKPHRIVRDGGHQGRMEKFKDSGEKGRLRNHPGYKFEGHGNRTSFNQRAKSPEQAKPGYRAANGQSRKPAKVAYNPNRLQKKTFRTDALD